MERYVVTDKYIAVSDIEKLKTLSHYHDEISYGWNDIQDLIAKAKPMVSYEDVRNLYINGDELGFVRVKTIKELIVEDPETYGGLTVEQWDQLILNYVATWAQALNGCYMTCILRILTPMR